MPTESPPAFSDLPVPPQGWRGRAQRLWRWRGHWFLLSATMLLLTGALTLMQPFPRIDRMLQDNARAAMGQQVTGEVVVVAIDDKSLAAIGRWPWRRALHAQVLRNISAQSPRCIGLNLMFTEEEADHPDDAVLAEAMRDSGCVVLPMALQAHDAQAQKEMVPIPVLAQAAFGIGHAHLSLDEDGTARSVYLQEGFEGRPWSHFVEVLAEAGNAWATGAPPPPHPALPAPPTTGGASPVWQRAQHELIVFAYNDRPFTTVSYIDVLRGNVPPDLFRGRHVLVGVTAAAMSNAYATAAPSDTGLTPGILIFANVLQGILSGRHVRVAGPWQDLAFNVLPLLVVLIGMLWLRPTQVLILIASMLALRLGLHMARPVVGVQFTPAVGFMALLAVYPAWSLLRLMATLRYLRWGTQQLNAELGQFFSTPRERAAPGDFLDRQMAVTAEAALRLRDLQRFVRDGINYLPDTTMVLDTRGQVLIANLAAHRHWRTDDLGLIGHDAHDLLADVRRRQDGRPMMPALALRSGLEPIVGEGEDAQGRILLVRCVPFYDGRNAHAGWLISLVDITRMRQAQSQRDEALRFISHDIREPSASILTILSLARSKPELMSREQLFDRIGRHAQTGLELADGFVSLARAEAQPVRLEVLDLAALLAEAVDGAWALARKRQVRIRVASGPEEALCIGDRNLLSRAIANVLSNALKYSPAGLDVRCTLIERPRHWALSVRDEGPGIAPELQSQLFRPFHRLHRETHPEVHGVGLGLLLVRTVLQRHGGAVEIDSAAHAGCTVTLALPKPTEAELALHSSNDLE